VAERRRSIPKAALKPLFEHCQRLEGETGRPAVEILREYLELTKKYEAYFFSKPWPETFGEEYGLSHEDLQFIYGALTFDERRGRFTLVCLRRNLSLEGFDSQSFLDSFRSYGELRCADCAVHEAKPLRVRDGAS
jgi:hypothetical protein